MAYSPPGLGAWLLPCPGGYSPPDPAAWSINCDGAPGYIDGALAAALAAPAAPALSAALSARRILIASIGAALPVSAPALGAALQVVIVEPAQPAAGLSVILNGADISDRLLPPLSIHRSESAAATARLTWYLGSATPVPPMDLIGAPITLEHDGARLFTGRINAARWDLQGRRYELECSDLLQELFEGKSDAQILALLPGSLYSPRIFGERADGWSYAQDCLSTIAAEAHLNNQGTLVVSPYAAAGAANRSYGAGQVLNAGRYELELATRRDLITRHKIRYQYRYARHKVRKHRFDWALRDAQGVPITWCDWARDYGYELPTREMITQAAGGTGWAINTAAAFVISGSEPGIAFESHPDPGIYCGGLVNWQITAEAQASIAISAHWTGLRHWAQTVTETYELTLDVGAMQLGSLGVIESEDNGAYQAESDDAAFEGQGVPDTAAWASDSLGDLYQDQGDLAGRALDLQVLLAAGRVRILDAFRLNRLRFEVPFDAALSLGETVGLATPDVQAKGKVAEITHTLDETSWRSELTLAISTGAGGSGDPLIDHGRPDTAPGHSAPAGTTAIATHVGGCGESPDYDETWEGFTTNRKLLTCADQNPSDAQIYPVRFAVRGPDIEDAARGEAAATLAHSYNLAVPQDVLVLS